MPPNINDPVLPDTVLVHNKSGSTAVSRPLTASLACYHNYATHPCNFHCVYIFGWYDLS